MSDDSITPGGFQVPAPGRAMLACACGRPIGVGSMYRAPSLRPPPEVTSGESVPVPRIVCPDCAARPT